MQSQNLKQLHAFLIDAMLDYIDLSPDDVMIQAFLTAYRQYHNGISDLWKSSTQLVLDLQPATKEHALQIDSIVGLKPDATVLKFCTEPKPPTVPGLHRLPLKEQVLLNLINTVLLEEIPDSYTVFTLLHGLLLRALLDADCTIYSMEMVPSKGKTGVVTVRFEHSSSERLLVVYFDYDVVRRDDDTISEIHKTSNGEKDIY